MIEAWLFYYLLVGLIFNLTTILVAANQFHIKIRIIQLVISIVAWPYPLYKLIEGAFKE